MKGKKLIIGILGVLVILGISVYYLVGLFGINISASITCFKPGSKPYYPRGGCYMPSIYDGQSCIRKADCGEGYCTVKNKDNRNGICQDHPIGCVSLIKEKDQFGDFGICFD